MKKYTCPMCQTATCYISWFDWLCRWQRPTIFRWRLTIWSGEYLCPQHGPGTIRACCD